MLTKFPFIVGLDEGNATVMREAESNAGLHEFVNTGWAQRGPGEPLPPHPNPYYLRYKVRYSPPHGVNGRESGPRG